MRQIIVNRLWARLVKQNEEMGFDFFQYDHYSGMEFVEFDTFNGRLLLWDNGDIIGYRFDY